MSHANPECSLSHHGNVQYVTWRTVIASFTQKRISALALVYFPRLVRPMLYAHLAVIYSLMIATLISIIRGELTQNDGIFVLVAVGSPCTIYLWFSALRSLVSHHDFSIRESQDHRNRLEVLLLKLLCLLSIGFEVVLVCLLFVPSSRIHFSQPSCSQLGKGLVFNLAWVLQYVREGLLSIIWIMGNAWFWRWWDKRQRRSANQTTNLEVSILSQ